MTKKTLGRLLAGPTIVGLMGLIPATGCEQLKAAQNAACCTGFTPGAELAVNFGGSPQAKAVMQAIADLSGVSLAVVTDVESACKAIVVDLSDNPDAETITETKPGQRATAWCNKAKALIETKVAANQLVVDAQPPSCTVSAEVQAKCEATCTAKAECEITPAEIITRCDPGQLSGRCDADCSAKCEGNAQLAVSCNGECDGTCEGTCAGGTTTEGRCKGVCDGKCRGTCSMSGGAKVSCEGKCTGGCSVAVKAPECKVALSPGKAECSADANCNGSCNASASAKATCHEGSMNIGGSLGAARVAATLTTNMPKLYLAVQGRGEAFKNAVAAIDGLANNLSSLLSVQLAGCAIPAADAIAQAQENVTDGLTAAGSVVVTFESKKMP